MNNIRSNYHVSPEDIIAVIRSGKSLSEIKALLWDFHSKDIAEILPLITSDERKMLYSLLEEDELSDIFSYLDDVGVYIGELDSAKAADIIEEMDADDALDVLSELEEGKRKELLRLIEPERKDDISLIASYDDDVFGSIMTTNYISVEKNFSVKEAMRTLIEEAADNDNISTIYVTEKNGVFCGAIELPDLIRAREGTSLDSITVTSYPFVYDDESISENIETVKSYSEDSIPVISRKNGKLLGTVTAQSLIEASDEEFEDDYAKLAGLSGEEEVNEPLKSSIKKRLPWLIILLFLALGVSSVVGLFEGVVRQLALVVAFQSLILDMAGNVGTQSLAVTILEITGRDLTAREKAALIFRETRIGFTNGLILGTFSFLLTGLYIFLFKSNELSFAFSVSACVGVSLTVAMAVSSLTGTGVPIIFKKLGIDPAVASGPLITTINDLVAVCIYYGLAWLLLINILQFA